MLLKKLRILPLGGLGEIGMNCLMLDWQGQVVLIDCGIQFPDQRFAGIDYFTPDLSHIWQRRENLLGMVVTHGHDDHIGAISYLAQGTSLDVYCSRFSQGLIKSKMSELSGLHEVRFHKVVPGKTFQLGPFHFTPMRVRHSIVESFGYGIETPVGKIVHTGDFKHDLSGVDSERVGYAPFKEWSKGGVQLMLSDSTNAERIGHTLSEAEVTNSFEKIMGKQHGRIFIALFASNIRRIENILWVAKKHNKYVALAGRSMHSYIRLAHENSLIKIPENTLVLVENTQKYPDEKLVILLTGSQAEEQSALLRVAQGEHKHLKIKNGDRVYLSSRFIPGNERAISSMINHLYRQGAEVTYEDINQIHVSGHGFQDELLQMMKAVKPTLFIPVHGEYRHLAMHAKLARTLGIPFQNIKVIENGQMLEMDQNSLELGKKIDLVKGVVVGGVRMESNPEVFIHRSNLSKTGVLSVVFVRSKKTRQLISPPALVHYGILFRDDIDTAQVFREAIEHLQVVYPKLIQEEDESDAVRLELRRFFKKRASHKPTVLSTFVDI